MAIYRHQFQGKQESLVNYSTANQFMARCRICMKFGEIPIFGNDENPDISADVMIFGDIKLSIKDDLPQNLCSICHKLLRGAKKFRTRAKKTDEFLKKVNRNEKKSIHKHNSCNRKSLDLENSSIENQSEINDVNFAASANTEINNDVNMKDHKTDNLFPQKENEMIMVIVSNNEDIETVDNYNISEIYSCVICDMDFESSDDYSQHCKTISHINTEKRSQKVKCEICNKLIIKAYLSSHLVKHSFDPKINDTPNKASKIALQCNDDLKSEEMESHRNVDIGSSKINNPVSHQLIEKTNGQSSSRLHHTEAERVEKKVVKLSDTKTKQESRRRNTYYVCEICGKVIRRLNSLKLHVMTHGSELKYKCMFCPYRGLHPALLKIHVRTHTGDYNYKCTQCPSKFINKSNLSKHMQRHVGPVDFKCDTCHRGFYSKLELERHFRVKHLGIKDYVCNICGKAFGSRNHMMNHQLKIHKREKLTTGKGRLPNYLLSQVVS